uniref:Clathrin light chain n=1 Tax=Cryptomonas curvata TaxID=233186 RepID=A0A7S0MHY8_9CRYP
MRHRVPRGSPEWEREQEDSLFDHMGAAHTTDERQHLHVEVARRTAEDSTWKAMAAAEERKAHEVYLAKKRRDAEQRLAAKKYTEETFAAMNAHRVKIRNRSVDGFKSMEAKELATEVERENPHASAQVIAEKAMKLLHLVLQGREQQLPSIQSIP